MEDLLSEFQDKQSDWPPVSAAAVRAIKSAHISLWCEPTTDMAAGASRTHDIISGLVHTTRQASFHRSEVPDIHMCNLQVEENALSQMSRCSGGLRMFEGQGRKNNKGTSAQKTEPQGRFQSSYSTSSLQLQLFFFLLLSARLPVANLC